MNLCFPPMGDGNTEQWKNVPLSKEEDEGIMVHEEAELVEEIFNKTLVVELWTGNPFNA